jgi:GNAT superfamily N-acetyltransferase
MHVDVTAFDPTRAGDAELVAYHRFVLAAWPVDFPEDPQPTFDAVIGRLRTPEPEYGQCRHWLAHVDGDLAATAVVAFPEAPNDTMVFVDIRVHPDRRRNGIGRAVLAAVLPAIQASGRGLVTGEGIKDGSPGVGWANALGFHTTQRITMQEVVIADVDPRTWQVDGPPGYRLRHWTDEAPADIVDSYARARSAIHDAPQGASFRQPDWTPERIRAAENELREQNIEQRVVVAVHEATGDVAGLTIVHFTPYRPYWAHQQDTAVLQRHRGHGLGRFMKAAMLRRLIAERPGLELAYTTTAADNTHMIRVNHALGYTDLRTMCCVEAATADLCRRFGLN